MVDKICKSCGELKPHRAKGLCSACYQYSRTGLHKIGAIRTYETCEILSRHATDLKDDDDRFHTDYIKNEIRKFQNHEYTENDKKILEKLQKV